MRRDHLLSAERDAESVDGQLQPEVLEVGNDRSIDSDLEPLAVFQKLPPVRCLVPRPAPADAAVGCKVMRMPRRAASGKIVRRGDRDLAQVRTESDGDHVLLDDFADADRGVIAARHDIHDLIVEREVEYDVGVRLMKGSQQRPQAQVRGRPEAMNANDAGRARAQLARLSDRDTQFLERRPDPLEQHVAGLGRETLRVFRCSRRIPTRSCAREPSGSGPKRRRRASRPLD